MAINLRYTSVDDLDFVMTEEWQAQTTDDFSGPNELAEKDTDKLKQALQFAESRAESYLTGYELPISPVPPALKYVILYMAKYILLTRDGLADDDEENKWQESVEWLEGIRDGHMDLPRVTEDPDDFVGYSDTSDMNFENLPFTDSSVDAFFNL